MCPDRLHVTGLTCGDMEALLAEVRANHAKLESCEYHEFELIGGGPLKQRYRCMNCMGEIDAIAYRWHEIGRRSRPGS